MPNGRYLFDFDSFSKMQCKISYKLQAKLFGFSPFFKTLFYHITLHYFAMTEEMVNLIAPYDEHKWMLVTLYGAGKILNDAWRVISMFLDNSVSRII